MEQIHITPQEVLGQVYLFKRKYSYYCAPYLIINLFMKKAILGIVLTLITYPFLLAQTPPELFNNDVTDYFAQRPAEKIYLQSDRDVYVTNDTLWFKITLTNAHTNQLEDGYRNIYVELVNDSNKCVIRNLLVGYKGVANSEFVLKDHELKAGKYKLRTYTPYQRNVGTDFYFEKNILVKDLLPSQIAYEHQQDSIKSIKSQNQTENIDFQVLPVGGYLSYGNKCTLAFKALASNGRSVEVTGWLKDENSELISEIKTIHAGMGKVDFVPEKGRSYYITLKEFPQVVVKVPEAQEKIFMSVSLVNDTIYNIKLRNNTNWEEEKSYYLISEAYGITSFFFPFNMKGALKLLNFRKGLFRNGVNRIILADENMQPISERLIFVDKQESLNIDIATNDSIFNIRQKVNMSFSTGIKGESSIANVSVCAISVDQNIKLEDYPQTIQSYLLLDSEIKGHIENPSYYFKDDSASTREKLDLLLMTQGWSNYVWSRFDSIKPDTTYSKDFGIEVSGRIKRLFSKKGVNEGKVTMYMSNDRGYTSINESPTGDNGSFKFPAFVFPDTISTFFQGLNKHDWKSTEVVEIKSFIDTPEDVAPFSDFITPDEKLQHEFNYLAYQRMLEDRAYNPQNYEHMLDEVTIVKSKKDVMNQNDGHERLYGFADNVIVNSENGPHYTNIWDFISGTAGVSVSGNTVSIRGADEPLFLLDGIQIDKDMVDAISMEEVDKVEILKNAGNLAIFGMKGGNGAIAIYTKRGYIPTKQVHYNGISVEKLRGYTLSRQFYSPNYEINKTSQKDHRATLYWNPNINVDSTGIANFSFFTSDDESPILIKIEGLSFNGEAGVGYKVLNVKNLDVE